MCVCVCVCVCRGREGAMTAVVGGLKGQAGLNKSQHAVTVLLSCFTSHTVKSGTLTLSHVMGTSIQRAMSGTLTHSHVMGTSIQRAMSGTLTHSHVMGTSIQRAMSGTLTHSHVMGTSIQRAMSGTLTHSHVMLSTGLYSNVINYRSTYDGASDSI